VDDARDRLRAFAREGNLGAQASRQRATLLAQLEMWDEAIAERRRLAAIGGDEDRLALAVTLTGAGRFGPAQEVFDQLLASTPPTPQLITAAATLRRLQRDIPGGLALYDRLSGVVSDDERILLMGDYLWAAGRRDQARRLVEQHAEARQGNALDPAVWLWLARAAFESGDAEAGRAAVARGLEADSASAPLLVLRRLQEEGITDPTLLAAMAAGSDADNLDPVLREYNDLMLRFSRDQISSADMERQLAEMTAEHPMFFSAWSTLAMLRMNVGDADGAARAATDAMRVIPGDSRPARQAAQIHAVLGRYDEALGAARTWRDRTPSNPIDADLFIAWLHLLMERPADAAAVIEPWEPVILGTPEPDSAQASILARVVAATGSAQERADLLARTADSPVWASACIAAAADVATPAERRAWLERVGAVTLTDDDVLALGEQWTLLADDSGSASDFEAALEVLGARRWEGVRAARASLHRALALRRLGQIDEAQREFLGVIEAYQDAQDPEAPLLVRDARGGLLLLVVEDAPDRTPQIAGHVGPFWDAVRADASMSALRRATTGDSVAQYYLAAGQPARAIEVLEQALVLLPRDTGLQARMVQAVLASGDRDAAARLIDRAPTREAQMIMVAAADLTADERPADAEWLLRRAYALSRDNLMVTNNLAFHLLTHGGDASEAAALAQESVDIARGRDPGPDILASVYDTLGLALLAAGRPQEAEQAFRSGLLARPENADLHVGLAEALHAQGRDDDARRTLGAVTPEMAAGLSPPVRERRDRLAQSIDP
jgi:tetratricopeptide (TPR) repeat protein